MALGVALDLGTSGYRGHLVDLDRKGKILATVITMRYPMPGANIMDHLHFWMENGADVGHRIVIETVDKLIATTGSFEGCIGCKKCQKECPECALQVTSMGDKRFLIWVNTEHCLGTACKKCQAVCPEDVFNFTVLKIVKKDEDA